ncbi:HypC/HybG/HupF family hydrogenase formation chaperone [Chloroflexota bacterium]
MCLAIPYKVLEVKENSRAKIEFAGTRHEVSLQIVPGVEVGDWVLVNLGSVVAKIEEGEAQEIMHIYQEIAEAEDGSLIGSRVNERRDSNE